jgi:signal peptide peptidase SppA
MNYMKYPRIFEKVFNQFWAITPGMHSSIRSIVLNRVMGSEVKVERLMEMMPKAATVDANGNQVKRFNQVGKLAIIPVDGVLGSHLDLMEQMCGGCSLEGLRRSMLEADADPTVERIIFAFHSPGGTVMGLPEVADTLAELNKPTVAFTDSLMCSAAYWLASQCTEVWVTPSSCTGSIGVYVALLDETVAMQMEGLRLELFKAGEHKAIGLPGRELSLEDRALLQKGVDQAYDWFTSSVLSNRPLIDMSSMQGQTFSGAEAVALHLADGLVNSFDELLDLAAA